MSKQEVTTAAAPPAKPEPERYLVARSHRDKFSRAGIAFSKKWQGFRVSDLKPEQLDRIQGEREIESRIVSKGELEDILAGDAGPAAQATTIAELRQQLAAMTARCDAAEAKLAKLAHAKKGDLPPADHDPPPGQKNPLPTPDGGR